MKTKLLFGFLLLAATTMLLMAGVGTLYRGKFVGGGYSPEFVGDGAGLTNIPQAGVSGLSNSLYYLTNSAGAQTNIAGAFSNGLSGVTLYGSNVFQVQTTNATIGFAVGTNGGIYTSKDLYSAGNVIVDNSGGAALGSSKMRLDGSGNGLYVTSGGSGAGISGTFIQFRTALGSADESDRWKIATNGHWEASSHNTYDIGLSTVSAAPRHINAGSNVYAGGQFTGSGAGLTNIPIASIVSPGAIVTNGQSSTITFSNSVYSQATTVSAPSTSELVTAGFVRGLFDGAGVSYYTTTNVNASFTNNGTVTTNTTFFEFNETQPTYYSTREYVTPTNGTYIGFVTTTNRFLQLNAGVTVNAMFSVDSGGSGTTGPTIKPEVYVSYDGTNWFGDWSGPYQNIPEGSTNLLSWVVANPRYVTTNANGFYVMRTYKVGTQPTPNASTITLHIGTNATVTTPSHISLPGVTSGAGNAFLAANQYWSGSNYFAFNTTFGLPPVGDGSGLTNLSGVATSTFWWTNTAGGISNNYAVKAASLTVNAITNTGNSFLNGGAVLGDSMEGDAVDIILTGGGEFIGIGSQITSLNPTNINSGTAGISITGNALSATTASTANAGDSATAFFPSGTVEPARLATNAATASTILRATSATTAEWGIEAAGPTNLVNNGTDVLLTNTNGQTGVSLGTTINKIPYPSTAYPNNALYAETITPQLRLFSPDQIVSIKLNNTSYVTISTNTTILGDLTVNGATTFDTLTMTTATFTNVWFLSNSPPEFATNCFVLWNSNNVPGATYLVFYGDDGTSNSTEVLGGGSGDVTKAGYNAMTGSNSFAGPLVLGGPQTNLAGWSMWNSTGAHYITNNANGFGVDGGATAGKEFYVNGDISASSVASGDVVSGLYFTTASSLGSYRFGTGAGRISSPADSLFCFSDNTLPALAAGTLWMMTNWPALRIEASTNNVTLGIRKGTNTMEFANLQANSIQSSNYLTGETVTITNGNISASSLNINQLNATNLNVGTGYFTNVTFTASNQFHGAFVGNGNGLTNINANAIWWPTNAGNVATIDMSKPILGLSTNNNLSITGITGTDASGTNFQAVSLFITNSSAAAKTVTMAATFNNMNASEGLTLYCTNLGHLLVFYHPGFGGTNFYWKSR